MKEDIGGKRKMRADINGDTFAGRAVPSVPAGKIHLNEYSSSSNAVDLDFYLESHAGPDRSSCSAERT